MVSRSGNTQNKRDFESLQCDIYYTFKLYNTKVSVLQGE